MRYYEGQVAAVAALPITGDPKWDISVSMAIPTCVATISARFLLLLHEHVLNFDGFLLGNLTLMYHLIMNIGISMMNLGLLMMN